MGRAIQRMPGIGLSRNRFSGTLGSAWGIVAQTDHPATAPAANSARGLARPCTRRAGVEPPQAVETRGGREQNASTEAHARRLAPLATCPDTHGGAGADGTRVAALLAEAKAERRAL